MKITKSLLACVPVALLVSCNLNSSDEGATKVSNYEKLPNCSTKESISGKSPVGEKVYIEEEESTYLCTDSGWVLSSVMDMESLPACPTKRGTNLGMKIYVENDSIYYLCVKSGWTESDSSEGDGEIPVPEFDNSLVVGYANAIGPFVEGGRVELREAIIKTGDTLVVSDSAFAGSVSGKTGYFTIPGVTTYSNFGVVTVKGLFKDALTGEVSGDSLELTAFVDLNNELKIDVFANLQFGRIKTLLAKGYEPRAAMDLSEKEISAAFGVKEGDDISTARLAIALLLRSNVDEADFVDMIASLTEDFADNGVWDDDASRTSLADFAFNIENLKLKDEDTDEILLKLNDYRKNLEAFGMDNVPGYEEFYNKFWVDAYGLGICGSGRQDVVMINQNDKSDSASAYFTCSNLSWVVSTDFERDTVGLGNAPDGTLHEGNVDNEKLYVFDTTGFGAGQTIRWKEADSITEVIGKACTDYEDVVYTVSKTKDEDDNEIYYGCVNRTWSAAGMYSAEIGYMCNPDAKNVVEKFKKDGTETYARCHETKMEDPVDGSVSYSYGWAPSDEANYGLRDHECEPYEIVKSGSKYYYCEDADKVNYTEATEDDVELGACRKALDGSIKTYKKDGADVYRACQEVRENTWSLANTNEDTYKIGKVCNADSFGSNGTIGTDSYICSCRVYDTSLAGYRNAVTADECNAAYPFQWIKQ